MKQKYTLPWRIFLGLYAAYFLLFVFTLPFSGFNEVLVYGLVLFFTYVIGLASTYLYLEGINISSGRFLTPLFAGFYTLAALIHSFILLSTVIFDADSYLSYFPFSIIDILPAPLLLIGIYPVVKVLASFQFKKVSFKKLLWHIYFWTLFLTSIAALLLMIGEIWKWTFYDYITYLSLPLVIAPLYLYIKKKLIFSQRVWRVLFTVSVIWSVWDAAYQMSLRYFITLPEQMISHINEPIGIPLYIIFIVLSLPYYYAFYKIAFDKKFFKHD